MSPTNNRHPRGPRDLNAYQGITMGHASHTNIPQSWTAPTPVCRASFCSQIMTASRGASINIGRRGCCASTSIAAVIEHAVALKIATRRVVSRGTPIMVKVQPRVSVPSLTKYWSPSRPAARSRTAPGIDSVHVNAPGPLAGGNGPVRRRRGCRRLAPMEIHRHRHAQLRKCGHDVPHLLRGALPSSQRSRRRSQQRGALTPRMRSWTTTPASGPSVSRSRATARPPRQRRIPYGGAWSRYLAFQPCRQTTVGPRRAPNEPRMGPGHLLEGDWSSVPANRSSRPTAQLTMRFGTRTIRV